jgi:hypothetical protein
MIMIRRNASKLGTRISEAEDVRKAVSASFLNNHARTVIISLTSYSSVLMNFQAAALHAWVRWHDRIKILSAQVAMGKKSSVAASKGIAGVPAGPLALGYLNPPHTLFGSISQSHPSPKPHRLSF